MRQHTIKIPAPPYIRILLLFLLLFHSPLFLRSQSTDDLEVKLKSASVKEKPIILNQLAETTLKSNPEKSISYGEQAVKAAKRASDPDAEAQAFINIGAAYSRVSNQKKGITNYINAIKIYEERNQPENVADLWNKIADLYMAMQKYDEAIDAGQKALTYFQKTNDKLGIVVTNIHMGDLFIKQKKYENSLSYFKAALKLYEDAKDSRGQVTILTLIANSYSSLENYDESYLFLTRALDLARKSNLNSQAIAIAQNLEAVKKNLSTWQKTQVANAIQKENETKKKEVEQEKQIKIKETEISSLAEKNVKSLDEINKLSLDAQLKELKIKTQQEDIVRKQMEAESQARANELLIKEKKLQDSELNRQKLVIWGTFGFSALVVFFMVYVFIAYRNKKQANKQLTQQNDLINKQKTQIEQKNILITDSIDYAKNIQEAILPGNDVLSKQFPGSFIFYKPKDIVSGDFYWIHEDQGKCLCIAAADCTGHGVPGAFMSLLGFIMLNDVVKRNPNGTPANVLKEVNSELMNVLHQETQNTIAKFGMDIALLKYDIQTKQIIFSGAHNPLICIRNGTINEIKADRASIGLISDFSFTNHNLEVKEGDMIYLFSDGYQDQIGGEKRKKFHTLHFRELLQKIYMLPAEKQKEELEKKHIEWCGQTEQTDDILVIGIKI